MIQNIVFIAIGFAMLMLGAQWLVDGASAIARKYHIPEIIIGLTIVSIGTSMPEFMVISIGNVIGSNICNLLLILGLTSIVCPLVFQKTTKKYDIPIMIFATVLVFILANLGGTISRNDGIILFIVFVCFIIYTIRIAKKSMSQTSNIKSNITKKDMVLSIFKIISGLIFKSSSLTISLSIFIHSGFISSSLVNLRPSLFSVSILYGCEFNTPSISRNNTFIDILLYIIL